jgi:hypothetical protein
MDLGRTPLAPLKGSIVNASSAFLPTPTGLLELQQSAFISPEQEHEQPYDDEGAWSPDEMEDSFDYESERLGLGALGISGLPASALVSGTPFLPSYSSEAPTAPRKGPTALPRVQGGSASASRCRERLAVAARPPRPRCERFSLFHRSHR